MKFLFLCLLALTRGAIIVVNDDINSAFVNDKNPNTYQLSEKLYNEVTGTDIGVSNSTLQGAGRNSTVVSLQTCTAAAYLFQVSTGYLAADEITFTYVCAHTLVRVTDADGVLSFSNVVVNQSSTLSYFASSLFNITGHGLFTNFTASGLRINSTANALFGGSPVELFFNVCVISDINFNVSATASLVNSVTAAVVKIYYFNNTVFSNFSKSGNGTGGLFFFNSSASASTYTFERCSFEDFALANTTRGGIVSVNSKGSLNFTLIEVSNVTGGINGSLVYSSIETSYFGRSSFHDLNNYQFGLIWVQTGTLAIIGTTFYSLTSICTGAAYCLGTAMTIIDSNFSSITSTNPRSGTYTSNTGILMGSTSGLLTISEVTFENLTGICNVCIYTASTMIGTNLKFLNSVALATGSGSGSGIGSTPGSPVAWYTKAASTMTNCLCENLTANYYSGCCKFYGTSIWNSCIFRYIKGTRNGGMCCQDGPLIADNCTFLNLSTTGDFGGAVHWHSYTDSFIRCLMYNCSANRTGGALLFGSTYFLGNCEFANNTANTGGNDIFINASGSPEPVTGSASPAPPTPSKTYIYGCCSLSRHPRLNNNASNEDQFLPNCTAEIRYVNTTERSGGDTVSCGTQRFPCASVGHTASEIFPDDIPLTVVLDYGVFLEAAVVVVDARPVKINGTDVEGEKSVLRVADNVDSSLFLILTGTLTCSKVDFLQLPKSGSLIVVAGNGTMTLLDCAFAQGSPVSVPLGAPLVLVNNTAALAHFEGCVFRNITVEDGSALWILDAKRISFVSCEFSGVVSTQAVEDDGDDSSGSGSGSGRRLAAGPEEAGGAITSNALELTLLSSSFTQCATARNGGAIFFGKEAGLSLTDITFDRNTAGGYGGALFIGQTNTSSNRRYLARCKFQNNVAKITGGGNDIRDVAATADSWTGANIVDTCSMSDPVRFSVGNNTLSFEQYLPWCYNNPCLDHTVADCPYECDNSSGTDCIPDDCTRLHHETTCSASCRMYHDNCVHDRCFELKDETTCLADHECYWDYPSSYTLSTGDVVVDPGTKVCQAIGECTRQADEKNCSLPQCILDRSDYCVPNKCYVNVTGASQCPQDCDWLIDEDRKGNVTCKATNCTRQGRETACPVEDGDCLLEESGDYTGRCTTDVCSGLTQEQCTAECQWWDGACQTHNCTRLHNETACTRNCVEDGDKHCIPADCAQRVPRTWEISYLCGPSCFLDPLAPAQLGKQCVATCPKDSLHTGDVAEGKCELTQACADRQPAADGTYPCGADCLFDPVVGNCGTECPKDEHHSGADANGKCEEIQPCAERKPDAADGTYPCGADCLYDPTIGNCGTECPKDNQHTGETEEGKCVIIQPCAERKPDATDGTYPCGEGCLYDPALQNCGTECPKDEHHSGASIDGKCEVRLACDERTPNLGEYYYCGDDCFYDPVTDTCVAACIRSDLLTGESDAHKECVPADSSRGGGDDNPPRKSKSNQGRNLGIILGVVLGLLLLIIAIIVIAIIVRQKKKKEESKDKKADEDLKRPIAINNL